MHDFSRPLPENPGYDDLVKNLLGVLYLRTSGEPEDMIGIRQLLQHFHELGANVPLFEVSADGMFLFQGMWEQMQWWLVMTWMLLMTPNKAHDPPQN